MRDGTAGHRAGGAAKNPRQAALIDGPSGETVDYGTLAERVRAVAGPLATRDFGAGDRLALWAPKAPAWAGVALGAMATGGAVAREIAGDGVIEIGPELLAAEPAAVRDDAPALLPFSSGTTGTPKPVTLTHANLLAALDQLQDGLRLTPRDRVLALAPFAHVMGSVVCMLGPLASGATVVTVPRIDVESFLGVLARHRITVCAVPPPVMRLLAFHPLVDEHDLSAIEVIACGGAPLAPALQEAVQRRFPDACVGQG